MKALSKFNKAVIALAIVATLGAGVTAYAVHVFEADKAAEIAAEKELSIGVSETASRTALANEAVAIYEAETLTCSAAEQLRDAVARRDASVVENGLIKARQNATDGDGWSGSYQWEIMRTRHAEVSLRASKLQDAQGAGECDL